MNAFYSLLGSQSLCEVVPFSDLITGRKLTREESTTIQAAISKVHRSNFLPLNEDNILKYNCGIFSCIEEGDCTVTVIA